MFFSPMAVLRDDQQVGRQRCAAVGLPDDRSEDNRAAFGAVVLEHLLQPTAREPMSDSGVGLTMSSLSMSSQVRLLSGSRWSRSTVHSPPASGGFTMSGPWTPRNAGRHRQ